MKFYIFLFAVAALPTIVLSQEPVKLATKPLNKQPSLPESKDEFCNSMRKLVDASSNAFLSVKGDSTTRMITGAKKKFFKSTIKLNPQNECYVNDNEKYPECECILASDFSITPKLKEAYESYKERIMACFSPGEWIITEKDSSNDFYLKGSEFKRLVLVQRDAEKKIKFHLYMYSSMIEKKRIVEVKIEGLGRKEQDMKPAGKDTTKVHPVKKPTNKPAPVKTQPKNSGQKPQPK